MTTDIDLIERREVRASYVNDTNTEVLTKIKALALLPDGIHASTEQVASFYEVDHETIKKIVLRHRDELKANGYRSIGKKTGDMMSLHSAFTRNQAWLAIFDRRAILLVGMLLRDSPIAKQVRAYLLDAESATPHRQKVAQGDASGASDEYEALRVISETVRTLGTVVEDLARRDAQREERMAEMTETFNEAIAGLTGYVLREVQGVKVAQASIDAGDLGEPNPLYVRKPAAKSKSFIVNAHDPGEGWIQLHDAMERKTTARDALKSAGYLEQTTGNIIREGGPWWDRSDLFRLCVYQFTDKASGKKRTARVSYANEAGTDEVRRVLTTLGVRI